MPYKNPADKKRYMKKFERENADHRRLQKRVARLKKLAHYRKISERNNRKAGFPPRAKGPKASRRVKVPRIRKWVVIEDRIYFNLETGFTREALLQVIKDWDAQEEPVKVKRKKTKK